MKNVNIRTGKLVTTTTQMIAYGNQVMPENTVYVVTHVSKKTPGLIRIYADQLMYSREVDITTCKVVNTIKPKINVGDVYVCSWGYEQTNIDFYMVVKHSNVTARLVKLNNTFTETTGMSGYTVPQMGDPGSMGNGKQYKIKWTRDGTVSFRLNSYSHAVPWSGQPMFFSTWH